MLCVHDSVIIQRNKEHYLCKFTELLKKSLNGEATYPRRGHVADGVGNTFMMLEQCRTATFLLVLQETIENMLSKAVSVVSQDLSSRR